MATSQIRLSQHLWGCTVLKAMLVEAMLVEAMLVETMELVPAGEVAVAPE